MIPIRHEKTDCINRDGDSPNGTRLSTTGRLQCSICLLPRLCHTASWRAHTRHDTRCSSALQGFNVTQTFYYPYGSLRPDGYALCPREPEIEDEVLWDIYRRLVSQRSRSCHRTSKSIVRLNRMESRQFEAILVIVASVRRKLFPRSFAN